MSRTWPAVPAENGRAEVTAVYADGSLFRNPSNIIVLGDVKAVDGKMIFQAYLQP